jgi:hypothetical protein
MADFSKQWTEIYDREMPWDFDIEVEIEKIPLGHYKSMICEGFGFTAISKEQDGTIMLYFPDWEFTGIEDKAHWIDYQVFIKQQLNKFL